MNRKPQLSLFQNSNVTMGGKTMKNHTSVSRHLFMVTAATVMSAASLFAETISITNPSAATGDATGWTANNAGANPGNATDGDSYNWWISGNNGYLYQSLNDTFAAGSTYTLNVDVIDRASKNTGWDFGLYYDNGESLVKVVGTSGAANWGDGTFRTQTVASAVSPDDAWVGSNIVVRLGSWVTTQDGDSDFLDNVRLQRETTTLLTSQASTAPSSDVLISQANGGASIPFRYQTYAGSDNNPRDAGQTFRIDPAVYPRGVVLDKITVNINSLSSSAYDGNGVVLGLYEFTDGADFVPDPNKDSPILTVSGTLPRTMKSQFDSGNTYLTFDLSDYSLEAGIQYGFLLMHMTQEAGTDNMLLSSQSTSGYPDGIGIVRQNRGTASDVFSAQTGDLQFYLHGRGKPAQGTTISIH